MSKEIKQTSLRGWSKPQSGGWSSVGKQAQNDPRTKLYADQAVAIKEVIDRELTEQQPATRLKEIKTTRAGLKEAVGKVNTEWGDADNLKKTLLKHIPKLQDFIKSHSHYYLDHTKTYKDPQVEREETTTEDGKVAYKREWKDKDAYTEALRYLEKAEISHTYTAEDIERQKKAYEEREKLNTEWKQREPNAKYFNPKPAKVGDGYTFKGYKIKDYDKFVEAVKKSATPADIWAIKDPSESDTLAHLNPVLLAISELAKELGVKPWGNIYQRQQTVEDEDGVTRSNIIMGAEYTPPTEGVTTVDIRQSDYCLYQIILWAVVQLKQVSDAIKPSESSEVTNIVDGKNHGFIMRPANMSLYEAFESAVYNPNQEFNTIFQKYRTPQELDKASGLHLSVAEQAVLPFLNASNDLRQFQRLMVSQIPLFYDLILALQDYKRENPNAKDGWVDVKELAKFIPRYAHDIEVKGSLRPQYRTLIADTYQLLKLFEIPFEKARKANGNKIYKYFKFINIDEVEVDKRGNIKALKLDFTQDYYALYSQKVAVILDGMRELDDPQVKMLGARISDYFVCNEPIMARTINGEPLTKKASELARWAGIDGYKNDPKKRYQRLAVLLKALADNGKIVGKWLNAETKKAEIRGYGTEIGDILIEVYPSENIQKSLITKAQRRASRKLKEADQKKYLKLLKKFDSGYTDRNTEAELLKITTTTLENMLSGAEPITSEVMDIVADELGEV